MKKYVVLFTLSLMMCVPPAPAKEGWPSDAKNDFISQCYSGLINDAELRKSFSDKMLMGICFCNAEYFENKYDFLTFQQITEPPLSKEIEKELFTTSYECARIEIERKNMI